VRLGGAWPTLKERETSSAGACGAVLALDAKLVFACSSSVMVPVAVSVVIVVCRGSFGALCTAFSKVIGGRGCA
jgi:hypothetical protein